MFIARGTLENIKNNYVKEAVTANDIQLTADEQTNARTWLNAVGKEDYATSANAGLVRCANTYGMTLVERGLLNAVKVDLDTYKTRSTAFFVGKGTLDNVLTQYSKTVLTTEADYNALETKDANTLYLIEE
jgi:hypothetical protein